MNKKEIGLKNLAKIDGAAAEVVFDSLKDLAPDLNDMMLEFAFGLLVGLSGLEPPTLRLSVVRSSQLSYRPVFGLGSRLSQHTPSKLNNVTTPSAPADQDYGVLFHTPCSP